MTTTVPSYPYTHAFSRAAEDITHEALITTKLMAEHIFAQLPDNATKADRIKFLEGNEDVHKHMCNLFFVTSKRVARYTTDFTTSTITPEELHAATVTPAEHPQPLEPNHERNPEDRTHFQVFRHVPAGIHWTCLQWTFNCDGIAVRCDNTILDTSVQAIWPVVNDILLVEREPIMHWTVLGSETKPESKNRAIKWMRNAIYTLSQAKTFTPIRLEQAPQ